MRALLGEADPRPRGVRRPGAQDLRAVLGHGHGVLVVGGQAAVAGDGRPAVLEDLDLVAPRGDHGLDGQGHPRPDLRPASRRPEIRHLGLLVEGPADAVSDELADDRKALALDRLLDGRRDVGQAVALFHLLQALGEGAPGRGDELQGLLGGPPDGGGQGRVAVEPLEEDAEIEADDVALLEDASRGDAVDDLLVDRDADRGGIAPVALEGRHGAELAGPLLGVEVEVARPDAGPDERLELAEHRGHDAAALAHGLELGRGLEGDHRHFPAPPGRPSAASRTRRTSRTTSPAARVAVDPVEVALGRVPGDEGLGLGVIGLEPSPG